MPRGSWRCALAAVAAVVLLAGCDWTQYGFDAGNTGHDPTLTGFTTVSVATLHQAWSVPGPGGVAPSLDVVGGRVYAGGGSSTSTDPSGPLEALDGATGSNVWTLPAPGASVCPEPAAVPTEQMGDPAVLNGQVLFLAAGCAIPFSGYGALAVDAATGATGPAPTGYGGDPYSDPVVTSDGGIWETVEDYQVAAPSKFSLPIDSAVVGPNGFRFDLDPDPTHADLQGWQFGTPAVDATHVYVTGYSLFGTSQATVLLALDRTTGTVVWQAPVAATAATPTPSVGDGRVFVAGGTTLEAFATDGSGCTGTPTSCAPTWSAALAGSSAGPPTISSHRVFVAAGDILSSFSTDTGEPLWSAAPGTTLGVPAVAADVLLVGTADGRLLAYDATGAVDCTGATPACTPVWTGTLPLPHVGRPVPASDGVYVSSADGTHSQVTEFVF